MELLPKPTARLYSHAATFAGLSAGSKIGFVAGIYSIACIVRYMNMLTRHDTCWEVLRISQDSYVFTIFILAACASNGCSSIL